MRNAALSTPSCIDCGFSVEQCECAGPFGDADSDTSEVQANDE